MGQFNTKFKILSSELSELKILWIPEHRIIAFKKGKRSSETEIVSDRDYFFYILFRILELYTWRHSTKKLSTISGSIIKSTSQSNISVTDIGKISSDIKKLSFPEDIPKSEEFHRSLTDSQKKASPRVQAVENVINSVAEMRRAVSLTSISRERSISNGDIKGTSNSKEPSPREDINIIFKEVTTYKSPNKEEILDIASKLIKQYLEDNDSGKLLLAINEYILRLPVDDIPHFINYRPNFDCLLNIELAYRLNFTSPWMTIPGSYLYLHEWKYLLDQGLLLFNSPIADKRLCLGQSSIIRYLDLLMETEHRAENGQIPINNSLPHYVQLEILENLGTSYEIENKDELNSYLVRVVPHAQRLSGMVAKTLVEWYYTFVVIK